MKSESITAKIFAHGRSQAVRLPKEFRMPGKEMRVSRIGSGVFLQPIESGAKDVRAILDELDRYRAIPFMEEGRNQPAMPPLDDVPALDE